MRNHDPLDPQSRRPDHRLRQRSLREGAAEDTSLKANGGFVLICSLVVALALFALWPSDDPATLPVTAEAAIDNQAITGATGEIDGERYLAVLTTTGPDLHQPALELFSVSDSGKLEPAGTLDAPLEALESELPATPVIAFAGETVYVPLAQSRNSVFWIVDVSDPETPRQISATTLETSPGSVAVSGDLAGVGPLDGAMTRIFDIAEPASPQQIGVYLHPRISAVDIELTGQLLYVPDRYGVSGVDISSLDDPHAVGRYEDDDWVSRIQYYPGHVTPRISIENGHLYAAADTYGVNALDISDATDPDATTRRLERNPSGRQQDIAVDAAASGEHLIVLSRRGVASEEPLELAYVVRDIDISSPGDPDVVAETGVIPSAEAGLASVAIDDSFAYFLAGSAIHVMSLSG